ncbi:hypothetical protein HAX54_045474 [Datura stramonium]|uniref:Uncharacterized protein n=1 Tax=Datura stramonium TaxID=4076 RepID=A0ABS8WJR9_DATST|nr:hypothetical protein [Datura stramonium]
MSRRSIREEKRKCSEGVVRVCAVLVGMRSDEDERRRIGCDWLFTSALEKRRRRKRGAEGVVMPFSGAGLSEMVVRVCDVNGGPTDCTVKEGEDDRRRGTKDEQWLLFYWWWPEMEAWRKK